MQCLLKDGSALSSAALHLSQFSDHLSTVLRGKEQFDVSFLSCNAMTVSTTAFFGGDPQQDHEKVGFYMLLMHVCLFRIYRRYYL